MSGRKLWRGLLLGAVAAALCVPIAGCGGDDDDAATNGDGAAAQTSGRFPESVFSPEIFGDLSGTLAWYEGSGGAVQRGREESIFKNFEELTGVPTKVEFSATMAKYFAAEEAGQAHWDLLEFASVGDWLNAKKAGYLAKLDPNVIPRDKLEDGAWDDYGYRVDRYATLIAWNTKKYPSSGEHPTSLTDLYDTERFPGKRCMLNYFEYGATLESALLADGVAPEDLYPLDVDRALAKLDTIKKDIVWYADGAQAVKLLSDGECDLGTVWNGRAYDAVTKDDAPIDIAWGSAMTQDAVLAIPKGAQNMDAAQAQLAMWLLDKQTQEEFLKVVPYPTPLKDPTIPAGLEKWLPLGDNVADAVAIDDQYFADNAEELNSRFTKWVGE